MIQLITEEKYRTEWNNVVEHPLQTWEWGDVKEKNGNMTLRIGIVDTKKKLTQAYTVTLHRLPFGKLMAYGPRGAWLDEEVIRFIRHHYSQVVALKIEANLWVEQAGDYQIPLLKRMWESRGNKFLLSNSRIMAPHTFVIDLHLSEEKLLMRMKSKTRYNIRLAEKRGVAIKDETQEPHAFDIFFDLYKQTIRRQNYLGHSWEYHETVWHTMHKAGMAKILIAFYQGKPLAAYQIFFFKGTAYYLYGGTSTEHKEVMASNLLMWEVLKTAKKMNCTTFDMWGALKKDYDPRDPWAGFHRFKEGYGGERKTFMPTIDVVFDPVYYSIFNFLWPIRTRVLEFINKF